MDGRASTSFIFICQSGPLELMALLLAASLRSKLRSPARLIAAVPSPNERWGRLAESTLSMLNVLGVERVEVRNEVADDYPIGNKVACLSVPAGERRLVFLDTDVLLVAPLDAGDDTTGPFRAPFAAKPADLANITSGFQWRLAYRACGVRMPKGKVPTTLYGDLVPPYFNAGVIAVDPQSGFGPAWLECCKRIDAKWGIQRKRPHLDQIALPVALHQLGLQYDCLDERYNFPAHLKPIDVERPPILVHYHSPETLRREPMLVQTVLEAADVHGPLADLAKADPRTAPLFTRRQVAVPDLSSTDPTPEVVVTGIPRSGTSYLCNLLHRYSNCVVLNEPDGVSRPLRKQPIPFGVGTFCRDMRRDVLEGRPIRNKLRDGKVTDETMEANEHVDYLPEVDSADFVLGVKNPLGFGTRLQALRRAMPRARFVACVRNPLDTIASWKTTFSHLASADVAAMTHGGLRDPFLSVRQRSALVEVAKIKHPAWRRAAWWRYLAEQLLDAPSDVFVVPYPIAVHEPQAVVDRILHGFNVGLLREPIEPSVVRAAKRTSLDDEDVQAIRALCTEAAVALGVGEER